MKNYSGRLKISFITPKHTKYSLSDLHPSQNIHIVYVEDIKSRLVSESGDELHIEHNLGLARHRVIGGHGVI